MQFKLAAVFSDNCVLQRKKSAAVFGEGTDGSSVSVELFDGTALLQSAEAIVKDGKWCAALAPMEAQSGLTLKATCGKDTVLCQNVAVGEVWLCGGQSNMEFELQNCLTGRQHLEGNAPDVRFYYTQKKLMSDVDFFDSEAYTGWSLFSSENARCWSAVGCIFAEKLSHALNVTVGLIGCNWGGTSASCWMDEASLESDPDTAVYLREYEKGIEGKSVEEQTREYMEYQAYSEEWNRRYNELLQTRPGIDWTEAEKTLGPNRWPGPLNCLNPFRPTALYYSMLLRVCPYTLKGFLFYQGESDDHRPQVYYRLFSSMIRCWRRAWQDDAPFIFVQLPGFRYAGDPDYRHWCLIREAQEQVSRSVKDAFMIPAIDAGEFNEIHPKDKEPVGDRLYRAAMEKVYGLMSAAEAEAPAMENVLFECESAYVTFKCACGSLTVKGVGGIAGFELASGDLQFRPAFAEIMSDRRTVRLRAQDVIAPKYARYLWKNFPEAVNLYGVNDLPALPFRTDDGGDGGKAKRHIQQVMEL